MPLAPANERESCFAGSRICCSQDTKEACLGRPICVPKGGRHGQPRHRARKEREDQILRKSCVCVALNRGDHRSNGGWLWKANIDVFTESELLKVKVPIIFLGTVGFSRPWEGLYSNCFVHGGYRQ